MSAPGCPAVYVLYNVHGLYLLLHLLQLSIMDDLYGIVVCWLARMQGYALYYYAVQQWPIKEDISGIDCPSYLYMIYWIF